MYVSFVRTGVMSIVQVFGWNEMMDDLVERAAEMVGANLLPMEGGGEHRTKQRGGRYTEGGIGMGDDKYAKRSWEDGTTGHPPLG